jgi:hypothetical protein
MASDLVCGEGIERPVTLISSASQIGVCIKHLASGTGNGLARRFRYFPVSRSDREDKGMSDVVAQIERVERVSI